MDLPKAKLYTVSEAAQILGVSAKTLRRWDNSGKIKIHRTPSGNRIFSQEDIRVLKSSLGISEENSVELSPAPSNISFETSPDIPRVNVSIFSGVPIFAKVAVFSIFLFLLSANIFLLSKTEYPSHAVLGVADIGFDLRTKIGELIVFFLPEEIKNPQRFVEIRTTETEYALPSSLSLNTLSVTTLLASTINTNTFDGSKLVFSGSSPSIYPSTSNTSISLNASGTGAINIGNAGTGDIYLAGGSGDSGCTINNSNGSLNCSSNITSAGDLIANGGDILTDKTTFNLLPTTVTTLNIGGSSTAISVPGNLSITGTSTLTGAVTANSGITVSPSSASSVALTVKGASSQSEDLLQIKNSIDTILAKIDELGNITGRTLESTVTTGTAPLTVASTTVVTNLNSNYVQGNDASTLMSQPQPNLVLNSDFSRRNKWMTFMPEVFSDTSGWTLAEGTSLGTVASNILTAGNTGTWSARAGLSTWRDGRWSAQFKVVETGANVNYRVRKYVDANNWVEAYNEPSARQIYLRKNIAGVASNVTLGTTGSLTLNNWYWLELEAQGTKYIAKIYSSGASPIAKSSATLVETITGDITDSAVATGYIDIGNGGANTVATQWGGLSTGDGGVYVEGWGPESWTATFGGTIGGQAIGFDESSDSGPLSKQWTMRSYIPATSRWIEIDNDTADGSVAASTAYIASTYMKVSGPTLGNFVTLKFFRMNSVLSSQGNTNVQDSGETSWTRKNTGVVTTEAGTRRARIQFAINRGQAETGTAFFILPQLEQGSTVTPWRNAPADFTPLTWTIEAYSGANQTTTSSTEGNEVAALGMSSNFFMPFDGTLELENVGNFQSDTIGDHPATKFLVDGTGVGNWNVYTYVANARISHYYKTTKEIAAGKHRIAAAFWRGAGTGTINLLNGTNPKNLIVKLIPGKSFWNEIPGADYAEEYEIHDPSVEAGDVVSLVQGNTTTVGKTIGGYQSNILGIIATAPGITLGNYNSLDGSIIDSSSDRYTRTNLRPVALQGRVPVKVTNENGVIRRGDILTSSNTLPGYAMKATRAGRSIGIAMEDLYGDEGKIMTFVNLSFYDPDVYLADTGELVIAKAQTTKLSDILGDASESDSSLSGGTTTVDGLYTLSNTTTKETIERIGAFNELFVANLKVGRLDVSEIDTEKLNNLELRIKNLELGTSSAILSASISGLLNEQIASDSSVLNSLTVLGRTVLGDLGITGKVTSGLLSIDGLQSSINSLSDLYLQDQGIGGVNILAGKVVIDIDGNLKVANTITAQKYNIDTSDIVSNSIGSGKIIAGNTSVTVITTAVSGSSKIFVTPVSDTDKPLIVKNRIAGESFEVTILNPYSSDISFDWFIIN